MQVHAESQLMYKKNENVKTLSSQFVNLVLSSEETAQTVPATARFNFQINNIPKDHTIRYTENRSRLIPVSHM